MGAGEGGLGPCLDPHTHEGPPPPTMALGPRFNASEERGLASGLGLGLSVVLVPISRAGPRGWIPTPFGRAEQTPRLYAANGGGGCSS